MLTVIVKEKTLSQKKIAQLHRDATRLKADGDLDKAIQYLQQAQTLMREDREAGTTIQSWLRLPLFLQQAGRFTEAIAEFELILKELEPRMVKEFSHQPKRFQKCFAFSPLSEVYDKMRLAAKREKRLDIAEKYQRLSEQYFQAHLAFRVKFDEYAAKKRKLRKQKLDKSL